VLAPGPGVTRWNAGDRVCPLFAQGWLAGPPTRERIRRTLGSPLPGTLRQRMVVDAHSLVEIPEHLSWTEAAALPCAGVTAWSALVSQAQLTPGDSVLLLGTGGVSVFALQLAVAMGLRTCITSSSPAKLERARQLGAQHTLNYREQPEWGKAAREWAGGDGVDLVVEVGGAGTLGQSLKAVRVGGQLSLIGVLAGFSERVNLLPILMGNLRVQGILVGSRSDHEALARALKAWRLHPVVDRVFAWEQAAEAFAWLASGQHFGKVAIAVDS
jgi:NADPH:quinone reductase-like Zn-dependent oxidoreductase